MKNSLPEDFILYFMKVWMLMFKKKIRIQKHYIEALRKNPNVKSLTESLIERSDGDFELIMPYSFMMGIYNYLSSLFHAASQTFFNKTVAFKEKVSYNLMAHSDDSGGVITGKSVKHCIDSFSLYEHFQKACNHLMSRKKSVLSENSFELISIMYYKNRFIPMTYKFITNIAFNPSGAGWYTDICSIVSLVVDIFQNGGSYLSCYSSMLSMSELLRKAYHLPRSKMLSSIPLHFGGIFNMHPIHLILLGSCCQEVMLDVIESPRARNHRIHMYNLFNGEYIPGRGSNLEYRIPYIVKHLHSLKLDEKQSDILSHISMLNERRTAFDTVKYFNDLRKMKFQYSLLNIDSYKIMFSTLFYRINVLKSDGSAKVTIQDLAQNFMGFQILGEYEKKYIEPYSNEITYLRAAESIGIDFHANTTVSKKSAKPMLYSTFVNLGLDLSYDDLCNLTLYNAGPEYAVLLKNPKKWESLTEYISKSLPGESISDKLRILNSLERQDVVKTRSAYLFIPSGTNIDTIERFWTFTLLMCSRRYFISKQKPQFYSLEKFEFWKLPYECLKHHYFIVKMILNDEDLIKNKNGYIDSIKNCKICSEKEQTFETINEFLRIAEISEHSSFFSDMPHAVYNRPQYRGVNVWYGTSDFELRTKFGKVVHEIIDGKPCTHFQIYDNNFLDQIWHLYRIFCKSRGIDIAEISYGHTGFEILKVAFNDLNTPYIPMYDNHCQVLENSRITMTEYKTYKLIKKNGKIFSEDYAVDFNIYNVSDINDSFYKNHNLSDLKDHFINKVALVNRDFLLNNFLSSKTYSILDKDEYHKNHMLLSKKYERKDLLGSPGSMTRALSVGNELGMTKYRSTSSLGKIDLGVLESQSISQVPIIDLYKTSAYSRINHFEYLTLSKMSNNETLDSRDMNNMESMISKIGISAGASVLITFKHMFRSFDSSVLIDMPYSVKTSIIITLLDAIYLSMEDLPKKRTTFQYSGKRREFWKTLKNLNFQEDFHEIAVIIVSGLYRAQSDNLKKFWDRRKENSFAMILNIHFYTSSNCYFLIMNILKDLKNGGNLNDVLIYLNNIKYYKLEKDSDLISFDHAIEEIKDNTDDLLYNDISKFEIPPIYLDPDSEMFDDDMDYLNENDPLEDPKERIYDDDFEELEIFLLKPKIKKMFCEYTITRNFKKVTIYTLGEGYNASWLGPCDHEYVTIRGINYNKTTYPGSSRLPIKISDDSNFQKYNKKTADDIYQIMAQKLKESEEEQKSDVEEILEKTLGSEIVEVFKMNNLFPTKIHEKMIPRDKVTMENVLSKIFNKKDYIQKSLEKRKHQNYLPGFLGIIKDEAIEGELQSLFGSNYHNIVSGNIKLDKKTRKTMIMLIKNMYNKCNFHHRGVLTMILSILRETIEERSDSWFSDSVFGIISDIEEQYDSLDSEEIYSAPPAQSRSVFDGEVKIIYEAYDEEF